MKKIIIIFSILFSTIAISQSIKDEYANKKGKLFMSGELEYRLPPISTVSDQNQQYNFRGNTLQDAQNMGTAVGYSFNYFLTNNFSLNFGQSIRYAPVALDNGTNANTTTLAQKSLLLDYHFSVDYFYALSTKTDVFLRLGLSMLNTNSQYSATTTNQFGFATSESLNTNLYPVNVAIGIKRDRLNLTAGCYFMKQQVYFPSSSMQILYFKIGYDLFKF